MDNTYFGLIILCFLLQKAGLPWAGESCGRQEMEGRPSARLSMDTHLGNCADQPPVPGSAMNLKKSHQLT